MENIDPRLRGVSPVHAFLQESRRRFEARLQQPSLNLQTEDPGNQNSDSSTLIPGPAVSSLNPANLTATIRRIKHEADFSEEAEVDFDNFCSASPEERQLLLMATTLQNRDLLQSIQNTGSSWELSSSLKTDIWQYAKAFLLSSAAVCYVGDSAYHVMLALRQMKARGLPAEDDITANTALLSRICYCLTTKRSHFKDLIKLSVSNSEYGLAIRNIACLAKKMIGQQNTIPQTRQLYMRLSVARCVYDASVDSLDKFWSTVDNTFHEMRKDGEELFIFQMNDIYEMDQEKYGDPAQSGIKTVELATTNLPSWVRRINELAPKVSIAQGEGDRPAKRRRMAGVGDSDDDEEDAAAEQRPQGEPGGNDD
ncbi:hypothetical protein ARMSODRAFT_1027203 [Armillaria solidipes]|uniref:Uncharacterized protein n=1 Tax=Armillaria solidipes TaxID=1076256 RepID=A0A2H3B727_9AGAR|nr:hypothetical protein ARMSODRAFT_1027203 [Armillaria solidipes]